MGEAVEKLLLLSAWLQLLQFLLLHFKVFIVCIVAVAGIGGIIVHALTYEH